MLKQPESNDAEFNLEPQESQISHMVRDSAWEPYAANALEKSADVLTYAKNDHLGFHIHNLSNGARRRFGPDFLIKLANGKTRVLEIKVRIQPKIEQNAPRWMRG